MEERLERLAEFVGGSVAGDASTLISGIAGIDEAGEGEITFLANARYASKLSFTRASAVIASVAVKDKPTIVTSNPYLAFAKLLDYFNNGRSVKSGVAPTAFISSAADIGRDVSIYPNVYISDGARIYDRAVLYPGVFIGDGVEVGEDTVIYSNVSVREGCIIGERVIIHCNAVIGSDGFGFVKDGDKHVKIPQVGIVRIEDDVEIGACVAIDRATMGETVIGKGTKVDNLVQIAHNVRIGRDSLIIAQVGISGSASIGERVTLAGQVGVVGHISIGDDCMVGGQSGVRRSLPKGGIFSGNPCIPHNDSLKVDSILPKLPDMRRKIKELTKEISQLKKMCKKK